MPIPNDEYRQLNYMAGYWAEEGIDLERDAVALKMVEDNVAKSIAENLRKGYRIKTVEYHWEGEGDSRWLTAKMFFDPREDG